MAKSEGWCWSYEHLDSLPDAIFYAFKPTYVHVHILSKELLQRCPRRDTESYRGFGVEFLLQRKHFVVQGLWSWLPALQSCNSTIEPRQWLKFWKSCAALSDFVRMPHMCEKGTWTELRRKDWQGRSGGEESRPEKSRQWTRKEQPWYEAGAFWMILLNYYQVKMVISSKM